MSDEHSVLAVRTVILEAIERHCETVLIFVDLWKAFDSLHTPAILTRPCQLKLHWDIANCPSRFQNVPKGKVKDSSEEFFMESHVRQGYKLSPLLFNLVFQFILKEVYGRLISYC